MIADPGRKSGMIADPGIKSGMIADPGFKSGMIADPGFKSGTIADPGCKSGVNQAHACTPQEASGGRLHKDPPRPVPSRPLGKGGSVCLRMEVAMCYTFTASPHRRASWLSWLSWLAHLLPPTPPPPPGSGSHECH